MKVNSTGQLTTPDGRTIWDKNCSKRGTHIGGLVKGLKSTTTVKRKCS